MTNVTPTLKYRILEGKVKIQAKVFQTFYVGTKYLYALQLDEDNTRNVHLMRGVIPTDGSVDVPMDEEMILANFGHTQTLQYNEWKGKGYFWIGMNNLTNDVPDGSNNYWSTQLGRVEFHNGITIDYTDCKRLITLVKANKNGTAPFSMVRSDGALSTTPTADRTDGGKQRLMFITGSSSNAVNGKLQFSCYNIDTINAKLDAASGNTVSCADLTGSVVSAYEPTSGQIPFPHNSWQGLEFSDGNSVYIAGGGVGDSPQIVKGNWRFSTHSSVTLTGLPNPENVEIEGLHLKGNYLYVGIENHHSPMDKAHTVYAIPKSSF